MANAFASSSNANVAAGGGGGGGIYRAGGPTTIFGGSGWGPFSDGPLNAVRKSLLSRDGVTEENWMWMMAGRVNEADEEWARLRKEGKGRARLSVDGVVMGGRGSAWERNDIIVEDVKEEKVVQGEDGDAVATDTNVAGTKRKSDDDEGAIGVYEPHSNLVLCEYSYLNNLCEKLKKGCKRSCRYTTDTSEVGSNTQLETAHSWRNESWKWGMGSCMGGYRHASARRRRRNTKKERRGTKRTRSIY